MYGDIMVMPCDLSGNVFYSTPGTRSTAPPIGVQQPWGLVIISLVFRQHLTWGLVIISLVFRQHLAGS